MHTTQYVIGLTDRASGPFMRIAGASDTTRSKLAQLTGQSRTYQTANKELGGSVLDLRHKIGLLRAEKEILGPKNLTQIKRYNREIDGLTRQIERLDNAGRGGKLKNYFSQLGGALGGILTNPVAIAGAGVGFAVKKAMSLDEGMAKVNITAQLDKKSLARLTDQVRHIAAKNKADVIQAPIALEQIISQTGDLDLSISILEATLKGSKAQFASTDIVAGALARTLSIVGKEKTNAQEVLDTFVASKRVGAGEFKDFAQYMPGLIAGAKSLGIGYKEVAGMYAYMTGKGQSAADASVLMGNLFTILNRGEVTKKMAKAGIKVFDNGHIRSTLDIFRDMRQVMAPMTDEQKSGFIEKLGIVDKEAKNAFMVMTADPDRLALSLDEVANSAGATDRALKLSQNSLQRTQELWNSFKGKLTDLGRTVLPVVNTGITAAGPLLEGMSTAVASIFKACNWWFGSLKKGNPLVVGLTGAVGAASAILLVHTLRLKAVNLWSAITAATSGTLARALSVANASLLATPWGIALVGLTALAAGFGTLIWKTNDAARTFASFRLEVQKSKDEANESFMAAMNAASGSEARAQAIQRINEQYGQYLPNMLNETASNVELAGALAEVNSKLEEKIRLKFRNMRIEAIENTKDEAKKALFDWVSERVAPERLEEAMADLSTGIVDMQEGKVQWWQIQQLFKERYGVGKYEFTEAFRNVKGGGFNPFLVGGNGGTATDGNLYNAFGKRLLWMLETDYKAEQDRKVVDAQYSKNKNGQPAYPAIQLFVNGVYQPQGTSSFSRSDLLLKPDQTRAGSPVMSLAPTTTPSNASTVQTGSAAGLTTPQYQGLLSKLGAKNSPGTGAEHNVWNLDNVPINKKGTGAYEAIVSKIGRVKLAGMAAAAATGLVLSTPASSEATALPSLPGTQTAIAKTDQTDYRSSDRLPEVRKICDQLIINLQHMDGQGEEAIRDKIVEVLMEIVDDDRA